jgi:hypothetical protein
MVTRCSEDSCYFPAFSGISSLITNHVNDLAIPSKRNSVISVEVQQLGLHITATKHCTIQALMTDRE